MSRISSAIHGIHHTDARAAGKNRLNDIHPLAKLSVTIWYITLVVSFNKYDLAGLAGMVLYLILTLVAAEIPLRQSLSRIWIVILVTGLFGIANPFMDKTVITSIGNFSITGGMVSMATLMLKGVFTVMASYILIVTTSIEKICYAMRLLRIPKILVTLILLIYRYIVVLLKEAERIWQAYSLRAPGQKGIHYKVWGTLIGQFLLRSIDRAQEVYESMLLRGYECNFQLKNGEGLVAKSILYAGIWIAVMLFIRIVPLLEIIGIIIL